MKEARDLVSWVKSSYQEMKSARSRIQIQWNLNLAFYFGNQYLEVAPPYVGGKLILPKAPPYRVRLVANRVRPVIRTEIARITSQKPNASVVPASSEDEDLAAAYAAEQVWESVSDTQHLDKEFLQTSFWTVVCGTGFIKTWWNPDVTDPDGVQGAIQYGCVTPYHFFVPDLRTVDVQSQPYVLNVYTRPVAAVQQIYGDRLKGLSVVPDVIAAQEIINDSVLNLSGSSKTEPDSVLCMELWAKPGAHKLLPQGGLVHVIGDSVVHMDRQLPYAHGEFPFTKFDHIPTGKFYSESTITDIIGLQREYNRTRSQIVEAKNRMAKPNLVYVKGSLDPSKITTEPGQLIGVSPGFNMPQPIPLTPLPNYVLQELDRTLVDIEDISGQHQVSRGDTPSGVTAATAISFLQEKDDSLLSHTYFSVEKGMENIAKQTLYLVKQYWDTQRTVRVVGTDGFFDVLQLTGGDICTDIRMEGGSALPTSKAARQSFLMDLMKMGFINPQDGLKLLDMGGVQKLYQTLKIDESQAQRENVKMKRLTQMDLMNSQQVYQQKVQMQDPSVMSPQGQPIPPPPPVAVNDWDNHAVHVDVHNRFRKSQAFELLPDPIKAIFQQHVQDHMNAIGVAMQQANSLTGGQGSPSNYNGPSGGGSGQPGPLPTTSVDNAGVAPPDMEGMTNG